MYVNVVFPVKSDDACTRIIVIDYIPSETISCTLIWKKIPRRLPSRRSIPAPRQPCRKRSDKTLGWLHPAETGWGGVQEPQGWLSCSSDSPPSGRTQRSLYLYCIPGILSSRHPGKTMSAQSNGINHVKRACCRKSQRQRIQLWRIFRNHRTIMFMWNRFIKRGQWRWYQGKGLDTLLGQKMGNSCISKWEIKYIPSICSKVSEKIMKNPK